MNAPPFKIAHVLPWGIVAGSELATLRIARAVEGERFTSIVFCPEEPIQVSRMFESAGFQTVHHDVVVARRGQLGPYLRSTLRLARRFRHLGVDFVHSMDLAAASTAMLAAKLVGVPVVCHIRNRCEQVARIERILLRGVDKFVFVSLATWRQFGFGMAPSKGRVIYDHPQIEGLLSHQG